MPLQIFNFLSRKEKHDCAIIKLYKVVNHKQAITFNAKEIIKLNVSKFLLHTKTTVAHVSLNYGSKNWKTFDSFIKFIDSNPQYELIDFSLYGNNERYLINFNNERLNRTENIGKDIIELMMSFPPEIMNASFVKEIMLECLSIEQFDYGYASLLPSTHDVTAEKKIHKGIFSHSVSITAQDIQLQKKLININNGYIKDAYQFNLLNTNQVEKLVGLNKPFPHLAKITENLFFLVLSEEEIQELKTILEI